MAYSNDKGCHSVYNLQFHYVACVKYRRKVLFGKVSERLKQLNQEIADSFGIKIIEQETDKDHIHILFASKPSVAMSRLVNSMKAVTGKMLMREFPHLKRYLWGGHFWSPSYFLATSGQVTLETLKRYVENQGRKNI